MQQKFYRTLRGALLFLALFLAQRGRAADGFDNNYFGNDANTLLVTLNGDPKAILFGPGTLSNGGFNLRVSNGGYRDLGVLSSFTLTQVISHVRTAYLDRVLSTTLYYRVYNDGESAPTWSTLTLQAEIPLKADSCYTTSQSNPWSTATSINFLSGLPAGYYVLEFYVQSELYDVGTETPDPCTINASMLCNAAEVHGGRFLSSRFNTTDPSACNLSSQLASLAAPTRVVFQIGTVGLQHPETAAYAPMVWPNPVAEELHFELPAGERLTARIANTSGQWIFSQPVTSGIMATIPAGELPKGLYFLVIYDEKTRRLGQTTFVKE